MPPKGGRLGALAGVAERNDDGTIKRPSAEESAAKLEVVGAGIGGIIEMAKWMSDDQVMWGLVRFEVGSGSFARTKVLFLHFNGDRTPALRRGMANELTKEVNWFLRGGEDRDNFHASIEIKNVADMTPEHILKIVSEFFVIDHVEGYDASWMNKMYQDQLAREQAAEEARLAEEKARIDREQEEACVAAEEARIQAEAEAAAEAELKKSQLRYTVGRDALQSVGEGGAWNWVLLGPNEKVLIVLGGGDESIEEMRACGMKHSDLVLFGVLRLPFGDGRLRRTKWAFVHIIGSSVSAVKRGKYNEKRAAMEELCKGFANVTVTLYDVSVEDFTTQLVIDRVRQFSVIDDQKLQGDDSAKNFFSVEAFKLALKKEQEELKAKEQAEAAVEETPVVEAAPPPPVEPAEPEEEKPPNFGLAIADILRLVRTTRACNWALFKPRDKKGGAKATPNLFNDLETEKAGTKHMNAAKREQVTQEIDGAKAAPKVKAQDNIAGAQAQLKTAAVSEAERQIIDEKSGRVQMCGKAGEDGGGDLKPLDPEEAQVSEDLAHEVELLVDGINRFGEKQYGFRTTTFGQVVRCEVLMQQLTQLSETLKAAKKMGAINYDGPIAHKGAHDSTVITLHKDKVTG